MISHAEASIYFDALLSKTQEFIRNEGLVYPVMILLKKGEPFENVVYEHPTITHIEAGDTDLKFKEDIYRLTVGIRMESADDDKALPKIAKDLVKLTNAEAVGLIMGCVYREIPVGTNPEEGDIYRDPESIRIINHCYYLKDDKHCYMRMIPYVNRGPVVSAGGVGEIGGTGPYEVLFINFPWIPPTRYNKAKLPDPFER